MTGKNFLVRQLSMLNVDSSTFTDESHSERTSSFLRKLREKELYCDLELIVDGETFKAHKVVLSAHSEYFREKLEEEDSNTMEIDFADEATFQTILDYVYLGEIELTSKNYVKVLALAAHLNMETLKTHCEEFMKQNLDYHSCVEFSKLSEMYDLSSLSENCQQTICRNFLCFYDNDKSYEMPIKIIEKILNDKEASLTKEYNDRYCVDSDVKAQLLFRFIIKYISMNWDKSPKFNDELINLLHLVNLPLVSLKFIDEKIKKFENLQSVSEITDLIDLLKDKNIESYPESWDKIRAGMKFESSKLCANGGYLSHYDYEKYSNDHLPSDSSIRKIKLQTRRWDGHEVMAGFWITYDNDIVESFGIIDEDNQENEYEFELEEDEHIVKVVVHNGWLVDSFEFFTNQGNTFGPYGGNGGGRTVLEPESPGFHLFAFEAAKIYCQSSFAMIEFGCKWVNTEY